MRLHLNMTVDEMLTLYPSTINVFLRRKMLCLGCPTEKFHTIEEAAINNGILLEHLMRDLREAIDTKEKL